MPNTKKEKTINSSKTYEINTKPLSNVGIKSLRDSSKIMIRIATIHKGEKKCQEVTNYYNGCIISDENAKELISSGMRVLEVQMYYFRPSYKEGKGCVKTSHSESVTINQDITSWFDSYMDTYLAKGRKRIVNPEESPVVSAHSGNDVLSVLKENSKWVESKPHIDFEGMRYED